MQKSGIHPGVEYAFREKRTPGSPLEHVRVIQHARANRWRVEWIEPNPGLIHYASSTQLVAPWKERKAFLQEEENEQRLRKHNEEHGYLGDDDPVVMALYEVYESAGDELSFYKGCLSAKPEVLARFRSRIGLPPKEVSYPGYVDRAGKVRLPFDKALELARKFCAVEPNAVLLAAETTEQQWTSETRRGDDHLIELLNQFRASWALMRQWAGHDAAVAAREVKMRELERLVWDAVYALQKAGLDQEAGRLRRKLERL